MFNDHVSMMYQYLSMMFNHDGIITVMIIEHPWIVTETPNDYHAQNNGRSSNPANRELMPQADDPKYQLCMYDVNVKLASYAPVIPVITIINHR